ncbi:hypothetical protein V2J09_014427 [Rumex salicifolius]
MVTQALMGSEGVGNTHESHSLFRQGSLYDLTLDEVQSQLGNLGKPLGSMNLDELLRTLWSSEAIDNGASGPAQLAPGSSFNRELSKKTVEELWREIQQEKGNRNDGRRNRKRQNTLGEMTLEEFLAQAGVSVERDGIDPNVAQNSQWIQYQMLPHHQRNDVMMSVMMPSQHVMQPLRGPLADSGYSDSSLSPTNFMGNVSDIQAFGRKRVAPADVAEKTVERRQKRMIKNRESAARSRARRQAYTQELENKVARLEDDNRRLRRLKEVEKVLPSAPPPKPKYQLRRTTSSPF